MFPSIALLQEQVIVIIFKLIISIVYSKLIQITGIEPGIVLLALLLIVVVACSSTIILATG